MSDEALRRYVNEIAREMRSTYTTLLFAKQGLKEMTRQFDGAPIPGNPDPAIYIGDKAPGSPESNIHTQVRYSELMAAAEPRGVAAHQFEQMWLVTMFHKWEDVHRPEIATIMGVDAPRVVSDVFGDMRYFRHDILKHQGIAQAHNTGRNKVLNWVPLGERISCSEDEFATMMDAFGVGILTPPDEVVSPE